MVRTLVYRDMLNFDLTEKCLGQDLQPHSVYDFLRTKLVEVLGNKYIVILSFKVGDVINFQINIRSLYQALFLHGQKRRSKSLNIMNIINQESF